MIQVIVADDHLIVRKGIRTVLMADPAIQVISEAEDALVLRKLLHCNPLPDILLLDLSMPGTCGLDALTEIKSNHPSLSIIILSMHAEEQYVTRAIRAGASGYLTKECAPEQLVEAIRSVLTGQIYVTKKGASVLAEQFQRNRNLDHAHIALSDREFQIMLLIAQGKSLTHIAGNFFLSVKTVSTYRARIMKKMAMKSNAELIQYVIRQNLLESTI